MTATFEDGEVDKFIQTHVCARCYGELMAVEAEGRKWTVVCRSCEDAWQGATITRRSAERRGQKALEESAEVKANLADVFPNPHKGKSAEQILKELGL